MEGELSFQMTEWALSFYFNLLTHVHRWKSRAVFFIFHGI